MTIEKIVCTCSLFPNQFEGVVDGKPFYFRARHGEWYLKVNEAGTSKGLDGRLIAVGCGANEPDGGWEPEDAEAFLRKLLDDYSAGRCPYCNGTGRASAGMGG